MTKYCIIFENHGRLFHSFTVTSWVEACDLARKPHASSGWITTEETAKEIDGKFAEDVEFPHYNFKGELVER